MNLSEYFVAPLLGTHICFSQHISEIPFQAIAVWIGGPVHYLVLVTWHGTTAVPLGSFGFANQTRIRIIYIRTNFSIHSRRLSSQSSLRWDGSGCEVVTLVSGLHHNWVFRNVLCLNTNHLHHACSLVGVLMKNHKLLSAPSHKTITQAKEKHNFAAKMITWLLNHSARCSIWCDITSAQIKSSERQLKRYSNVYSEIENSTKYVTHIKFDINWQTRRRSPVNVLSALLLLGNHVTTAVRIKRTEQGSWYLNLHLLSWIPLQVIPARKHRQVMNRKQKPKTA